MADQEFREASRQDVTVMFTAFREERGGIEERGKIQVADKRQEPLGLGVDRPARPRLLQVDREALLAWNIGGAKEFQRAENRWPSSWRTTSCSASGLSVVSTIEVEAYSASPPSLRPNVASRSRCQRNTRTLSRCRSVSPNQPASSSITDSQSRSNSGTSSLFASSGKKWMTTLWARWGVESSSSSGKAPKPEPRGLPATACKEKNRQRPHCHLNTYKKDPLENRQHEPEKKRYSRGSSGKGGFAATIRAKANVGFDSSFLMVRKVVNGSRSITHFILLARRASSRLGSSVSLQFNEGSSG
jgi:hypothetical protein